ncbi:calcium-binding protein [Shinella sp.]|uniref:calcium-binding protein n=1 Tax=Shinella sp. TaxID=1870904 RepID=UPI0029B36BF6|nr:calcium-binding protein [Shinella sp.]MDX3976559.1 calcium-binding protein [Shinella sp.]
MIVTVKDDQTGFGNAFGIGGAVLGFTSQITSVPKTTTNDVSITLEYFGDFNDGPAGGEALTLNIEGVTSGPYTGQQYNGFFGPASPTTVNLTIAQATWANIIKDGVINISYDVGWASNNLSDAPNVEEFVKLKFLWNHRVSTPDPVKLVGTDGDDALTGTGSQDIISGLGGNDTIMAGGHNDTVNGGLGDDYIDGGNHADVLNGQQGNDKIFGGQGDDAAYGGIGDDLLEGGGGHDKLSGGDGNDELFGNMGSDTLVGGAGKDTLNGGLGDDKLSGGFGADTFIFGKNEGNDVIRDFQGGRDLIDLTGQTYTIVDNGDGFALLELSGGGTILLNGIAVGDVSAEWFLSA